MSEHTEDAGETWVPTWAQAMTDFRGEDEEPDFDDVTVRMSVPAALGGDRIRVELSNAFGDETVRIGHAAIGTDGQFLDITFAGQRESAISAGRSRWTDPVEMTVKHGSDIVLDVYLPETTPYATAAGFRFDRSIRGDFAGSHPFPLQGSAQGAIDESREFPAGNTGTGPEPDGSGWSLPAGGPFLRTIEVSGVQARAVIVAFGGSSTAMGWPQYTSEFLPADARIAVVNRGISGNRIRLDAPPSTPAWGRAGLSRFDEDVLGTAGVTQVVIAYNSNDWSLPGRLTPLDEMPTIEQLIAGYRQLIDRSHAAGLGVILATVTPLARELLNEPHREGLRLGLNAWIRDAGHRFETDPSRLEPRYAAPDHTHPNVNGEKRLAQVTVETLARLKL